MLDANIGAFIVNQRQRRFCIVSQSRIDRSCESFVATAIGFPENADEKGRKGVFAQAAAFRRAVEKGGERRAADACQTNPALSVCIPIVQQSALARACWDDLRKRLEGEMRKQARQLHVWPWVNGVAGFGDLGLAKILGETGDLTGYATKERVWKRLGLAVIEGERQQRKSGVDAAAAHGFNPMRRAEVWTVADSMFLAQWRGARDNAPAHAIGPYGAIYAARKLRTADRDWYPKRRDADARRIMTKALIEDLWRVWNGKAPLAVMPEMPS